MFKGFRLFIRPIAAVSLGLMGMQLVNIPQFASARCDFDSKGFPSILTLATNPNTSLMLAGVGMRRKNLWVVEVDVYLAALNLSKEAFTAAKQAQGANLSDALLAYDGKPADDPRAAVTLKFVRDVTTAQIVEAFNDAFVGLEPKDVELFKAALGASVGDKGINVGEQIGFFWLNSEHLVITKNGVVEQKILSPKVGKCLLGVYLDPAKAVSKELIDSVHSCVLSPVSTPQA